MEMIGILISLIILAFSGQVQLNGVFLMETAGFVMISLLLITTFAVFGLLSSVVTHHSNISLLISLCFWLFAAVVIPNTSIFWAKTLFDIPTADEVARSRREAYNDINRNAPEGSWASNGVDAFFPNHKLRAQNITNLMNSNKKHNDAYYLQQFHQTHNLTLLSPIAQFDYMNEAFLGGGYMRFQKNWNDLHAFQEQFLRWFKNIAAYDRNSPHWYNPRVVYSTSKKPVASDQIPQYREQIASFRQRIGYIIGYMVEKGIAIAALFMACFYFFARYDVR